MTQRQIAARGEDIKGPLEAGAVPWIRVLHEALAREEGLDSILKNRPMETERTEQKREATGRTRYIPRNEALRLLSPLPTSSRGTGHTRGDTHPDTDTVSHE